MYPFLQHALDLCDGAAICLEALIEEGRNPSTRSERVFFFTGQFLLVSARLSRFLEPRSRDANANEIHKQGIANLLGISDLFGGLSAVRNRVEHMDEDLIAYLSQGDKVHLDVICRDKVEISGALVLRKLNTRTMIYSQREISISLSKIIDDIGKLLDRAVEYKSNTVAGKADYASSLRSRFLSIESMLSEIRRDPETAGAPFFLNTVLTYR